jgi:hypothetical protein
MKKISLLITALCLLALSLMGLSMAAEAQSSDGQVIKSYEGNITEKETISIDLLSLFGSPAPGYFSAEAVKFKAPKANWRINKVRLYAWDGYNGSVQSIPSQRIFSIEIRDRDLNLLYKFADSQLPYSNFARNATGLFPFIVNIPEIPVSDEFYVFFYDRGAIAIACEFVRDISKNSFIYIEGGDQLVPLQPAVIRKSENESTPINWIMEVSGR